MEFSYPLEFWRLYALGWAQRYTQWLDDPGRQRLSQLHLLDTIRGERVVSGDAEALRLHRLNHPNYHVLTQASAVMYLYQAHTARKDKR